MDPRRVYVLAETNWHVSFVLPWTAWAKPQHINWRFGVSCSHHFETTYVYKVYRTSQHRCFRNSGNVGWRLVPILLSLHFVGSPNPIFFSKKISELSCKPSYLSKLQNIQYQAPSLHGETYASKHFLAGECTFYHSQPKIKVRVSI